MNKAIYDVMQFLLGEGKLEGCGFGEKPEGERGNFWWRKHLRKVLSEPELFVAGERHPDGIHYYAVPMAWMNTNGAVNKLREAGWSTSAAPVDAKAIRAEALEEAAKVCEKRIGGAVQNNEWWSGFKAAMKQCAAAIRGLK